MHSSTTRSLRIALILCDDDDDDDDDEQNDETVRFLSSIFPGFETLLLKFDP